MPTIDAPVRNVRFDASAPVPEWSHEVIETVIARGSLSDWRLLAAEITRQPWGRVARSVETVTSWGEHYGVDRLLGGLVTTARRRIDDEARLGVAADLKRLRLDAGLTLAAAARLAGTSPATLGAYEAGRVAPSSTVAGRIRRVLAREAT
jgi:DNA-binding XRE family transcriptional regulator